MQVDFIRNSARTAYSFSREHIFVNKNYKTVYIARTILKNKLNLVFESYVPSTTRGI